MIDILNLTTNLLINSFYNVSRKVDYHAGGKRFIHGPKRRKENKESNFLGYIVTESH